MIIPEKVATKVDEVYGQLAAANKNNRQIWLDYELFTWQWYLSVLLSIIPWIVWWRFRKKESTNRLLCGAFFIIAISMIMDSFGTELGLWDYRYEIIPFLPSYIPWDLCFLPVIFMFLVQLKPKMSLLWKAVIYSVFGSFIGEPIFQWLGYYQPLNWHLLYSFPIYFFKFLIGYILVNGNKFEVLKAN